MALYPDVPVLALGDYNNTLDNSQDRMSLTPRIVRQTAGKTAFAALLLEMGLCDVWRERHEEDRCYSCYSATHDGFSHIDLGLGNEILLQRVVNSAYEPCLLSDHSPFWVRLDVTGTLGRPLWKVNPFGKLCSRRRTEREGHCRNFCNLIGDLPVQR